MTTAAISSARPCQKACSSSPGLEDIQNPMITTNEVSVSDMVCQASVTIATEPALKPTKSLKTNSTMFKMAAPSI